MLVFSSVTVLTVVLIVGALGALGAGAWLRAGIKRYLARRLEAKRARQIAMEQEERLVNDLLRAEFSARRDLIEKQKTLQ